jgi:glutathione S-transferase
MQLVIGNYSYSSWSMRAWLAVSATGAPFQSVRIPMDCPEFERRIGDYSPTRKVPVLLAGEDVVWDSLAICEYLAERFPATGLWPDDPASRALARSISCEMHSGLPSLRAELPFNCRATGRRVQLGSAARGDIVRVQEWITECRRRKAGEGWLFGRFGIIDCMLIPVLLRFNTYGLAQGGELKPYLAWILRDRRVRNWLDLAAAETETLQHEERGIVDE